MDIYSFEAVLEGLKGIRVKGYQCGMLFICSQEPF